MKKLLIVFTILLFLSGCDLISGPRVVYTLEPGNDIVDVNGVYNDPGCIVSIDGQEYTMDAGNEIDTDLITEQLITYSVIVEDEEYLCYRVVKVLDQTSPTATINPGIDTILVGDEFTDAGVTAFDEYSDDVTITVDNPVDTTVAGTYHITYTVTDEAGNETIIIRVVTVVEPYTE